MTDDRLPPTRRRPSPLRRAALAVAGALGAVVLVAGGAYLLIESGGNVHAVEPGVVYRAAQPTADRLDDLSRRYGIRSVINLRGDNAGQAWYDDELRVSRAHGITHVDVRLSAERELSPAEMAGLLRAIDAAPKPLLIHCNGGADRTGLASALYELSRGAPPATADGQLSIRYGHFPWLWSRTGAMDRSFAKYVAAKAAS